MDIDSLLNDSFRTGDTDFYGVTGVLMKILEHFYD
jgi:hypothetical protein